ncbi:MAG TPA: polysaccharide deacetylase family protein [Gemmatimonadales bacterium]|nr:polysaccharide deacetylase family protein [Gemmatimonadales bacterium]
MNTTSAFLLFAALGHPGANDKLRAPPPTWGVAVLEAGTSPDAAQEQLAVRDALELVGVPFFATRSVAEATRRPLVLISGVLTNTDFSAAEREALYRYVERGGVLLGTEVQGNTFFPLFGLTGATASRTNFQVNFTAVADAALRYVNRAEERTISLGDPKLYSETIWSTEYAVSWGTQVLATYGNGAAAFTLNPYGRGLAYALGLGFKETSLIPELARSYEAARRWINWFEPSGDVFRLILRALYESTVHPFVLVHTVPDGKRTGLCLSHDVDARESFRNSVVFATMEASLGVHSTFFVTTKYFTDSTDIGYYTPDRVAWIRQALALGAEIGSHSVSHSEGFERFPVGSPQVTRQVYDSSHPTVFGEVRVSKELLQRDLGTEIEGFRSGYLLYPNDLESVLEQSNYLFDSSVSAQWVLTNFPFFGFRHRSIGSEHSRIVEVPVTLDDSRGEQEIRNFLTAETQEQAFQTWMDVIHANAKNGALSCLLIHPTDTTYKLATERRLIEAVQGPTAWIGTVGALARFWRDRARLHPTLVSRRGSPVIVLEGMTSEVPVGQALVVEGLSAPPRVVTADGKEVLVRPQVAGDRTLLVFP